MFDSHIIVSTVVLHGGQLSPSVASTVTARAMQPHSQVRTPQLPPSLVRLLSEEVITHRMEHEVKLKSPIFEL